MARLIALVLAIAIIAALAPKFAPGIVASFVSVPAPEEAPSAPAPRSPGNREVTLRADARGHFMVDAVVNGRTVEMMVDTGATTVALNDATARRLGIRPAASDFTGRVSTANGVVAVAPVLIDEIRIGSISVRDVEATVVPGNVLPVNLLGMNFLRRAGRFEVSGGRLSINP